jgi:putative membrane-bound dehydrogenase-like protein
VKAGSAALLALSALLAAGPPQDRFPPLKVPEGFRAVLFAADPLIEYPSVLAHGPRPGSIYLAHDYVTGLGIEIVRRDEVRLVEDTDGDGVADRSTLFAGGFNSIQGLALDGATLFVMHAPLLTALRDLDGDGRADERRDLLEGIGWPPEKAPDRLHCANGVVVGHDGWLYLALGDRGCDVARPEGDRLVLHGGGILRCRKDGTDLHVFATGLRNTYDLALDDELNVLLRDNENDGGTYLLRIYHSFFGADHGYPYLYEERPDEATAPLADLGRGSSAGATCYLETRFPPEYHGALFLCEWGRSVNVVLREPRGSTFAPMTETVFASGDPADPYGFKPTDVIVDADGSLLVADWADDQRPKRGRGRVYRIRVEPPGVEPPEPPRLDHPRYSKRCAAQAALERDAPAARRLLDEGRLAPVGRFHAVWALARADGPRSIDALMRVADSDPDPRVRAQAVRAIADLADPVLVRHRLDAGPGDAELARRLAALARGQDPRVRLQVVVALGRLRWDGAPEWLRENLAPLDPALAHAAQQTLRRSRNWPAVLKLLDAPDDAPIRSIALRAAAEQFDPVLVDGLIGRLREARRFEIADLLTRVHRKPGPWVYWGFRPGPRPANTARWERTEAIEEALDVALAEADPATRAAVLGRMEREQIPARIGTLARIVGDEQDTEANRRAALEILARGLDDRSEPRLLELAAGLKDPPLLAETIRLLGTRPRLDSRAWIRDKLGSNAPQVRAAAIDTLSALDARDAGEAIAGLLADSDPQVRRSAASASGKLGAKRAAGDLLKLAGDPDPELRRRCFESLALVGDRSALPAALAALNDRETATAALRCVAAVGGPDQAEAVAEFAARNRSLDVLDTAVRALDRWSRERAEVERSLARVQGAGGILWRWDVVGPLDPAATEPDPSKVGRIVLASGADGRVDLPKPESGRSYLAATSVSVPERMPVQFLASSNGTLEVMLDGKPLHRREAPGAFAPDSDRFDAELERGMHRVGIKVSAPDAVRFHARFRPRRSEAQHERLTQAALAGGDAARGRALFFDAQRIGCSKCHRIGAEGGRIGPDLTGAGRRFSRIHLIESILEPSRAIAPAYQNVTYLLKDGAVAIGVKLAETPATLTIGDPDGVERVISKDQVQETRPQALSLMPEGLEKTVTEREFADLIAYLASLNAP